jgi:putative pyrimidine permease RutG
MSLLNWQEKPMAALADGGVIAPDERLPWPQTAVMGVQHVVAMFGATVLAPILMGFDPNLAILMSGIGTLHVLRAHRRQGAQLPGLVLRLHRRGDRRHRLRKARGPTRTSAVALGGIIACGAVYTLIGALVQAAGTGWIEKLMPPVVTGAVVAAIGLNLAAIPIKNMAASNFDSWMQALTFVCVARWRCSRAAWCSGC